MQINWFYSDCNFRYICCTNFFELHCAFLVFANFVFHLLILLYSLECAGVFRSCGSDHGLCPLDSHKPLKRLDRNFYMGALLLLCCAAVADAFFGFALSWARPKIKIQHNIRFYYFIRLKSFSVFSIVVFATISGAMFFISAILSMTCTIIPLSQRFPRFGSGAI